MNNEVISGKIIERPDFIMKKYPVYYVCITDPTEYDAIASALYSAVAEGDGHLILSAGSLRETFEDINVEGSSDAAPETLATLQKIIAKLSKTNFNGDVWFYTN